MSQSSHHYGSSDLFPIIKLKIANNAYNSTKNTKILTLKNIRQKHQGTFTIFFTPQIFQHVPLVRHFDKCLECTEVQSNIPFLCAACTCACACTYTWACVRREDDQQKISISIGSIFLSLSYLFWERQSVSCTGAERRRERESQAGSALSAQSPKRGWTHEPRDRDLGGNQESDA